MTKEEIVKVMDAYHGGSYISVVYQTVIPTKGGPVTRITTATFQAKCSYTHLKDVVKSSGTTTLQKWLKWDECKKYLLHYNYDVVNGGKDASKKGTIYLRLAVSKSPKHHETSSYIFDGEVLTPEKDGELLEKLATVNKGHSDSVKNINIANIIKLGNK